MVPYYAVYARPLPFEDPLPDESLALLRRARREPVASSGLSASTAPELPPAGSLAAAASAAIAAR